MTLQGHTTPQGNGPSSHPHFFTTTSSHSPHSAQQGTLPQPLHAQQPEPTRSSARDMHAAHSFFPNLLLPLLFNTLNSTTTTLHAQQPEPTHSTTTNTTAHTNRSNLITHSSQSPHAARQQMQCTAARPHLFTDSSQSPHQACQII